MFEVWYRTAKTEYDWVIYGSFYDYVLANACRRELVDSGILESDVFVRFEEEAM